MNLPKEKRMKDSLGRLEEQPASVQIVKLADRIVNLSSAPDSWSINRRKRYANESEQILEALGPSCDYLKNKLRHNIDNYRRKYC